MVYRMIIIFKSANHPDQVFFRLEPDHGFPLRLVVPGQIGGRSVKWLSGIELSTHESQHHLHFYDNKVLPMPLGADRPRAEKEWWYDPRFVWALTIIGRGLTLLIL